jgi:hypothetical protein
MHLCLALAVVLIFQAASCAAAPPKVAVLGGEQTGWNDLLVARLSQTKAVALVERQQFRAVSDEQAIQRLLENIADRCRIGGVEGADLLVLLAAGEKNVRLVVCDSHLGITVQDISLPIDGGPRDQIVAALADQMLRAVRQFEGGVKYVVAVPDFVSRDLTFEHSFLQFDYAEVLRAACRQIPGLAVVAVAEARAIGAERDLAAVGQGNRPVPLFIEGEYRTRRSLQDGSATVEITLRARDAAGTLLERKLEAVPLDEAGRRLLDLFTGELAGLAVTGGPALDVEDQYRLLVQRAKEFSSRGEFRRSAALREAALLLKPDADDERIQLVREYTRRNSQPVEFGQWPKGARQSEDDPFWMAIVAEVVGDWNRSLQHCEYLIRNRRLCREEATDLAYNAIHSITGIRVAYSQPLSECEAVKKEFLRHAFARIASLDPADKTARRRLTGALDACFFIFASALLRCDGNYYTEDDLDLIADLLLNRLPESMWPCYKLNFFLRDVSARMGRERETNYYRFTEEQYQAFLDRLVASDRPLARIYGRYGKLCYRRHKNEELSPKLLQEAQAIVADAHKAGFEPREYDYYMGQLRQEADSLARALAPKAPAKVQAAPPKESTIRVSRPKSRVSLEPIDLTFSGTEHEGEKLSPRIKWHAPGGWSGVQRFRPLGEGLDALWASAAVLFISQPGKVTQVLADEKLSVDDVISDGRYVWVAASSDWGLSVLNRQGRELARIAKDQDLPPCGRFGMVAHPLGPGRVLAAGSFGNENRGWIAIVEFDGVKARVEVIHEATKVWDYKRADNVTNVDPAMSFVPEAMFEHVLPGAKPRRIIFILRRYNPLLVEPETGKVWVYPVTNWYRDAFPRRDPPGDAFLSIDGVLWIAGAYKDFCSYRLNEQTGLLQVVRDRPDWHMGNARGGSLARVGDWLYYAGDKWRRVNLRTEKEELLVDDPRALPRYGSGLDWQIANSSHYGLVAFCGDTLYRVLIDERASAAAR